LRPQSATAADRRQAAGSWAGISWADILGPDILRPVGAVS